MKRFNASDSMKPWETSWLPAAWLKFARPFFDRIDFRTVSVDSMVEASRRSTKLRTGSKIFPARSGQIYWSFFKVKLYSRRRKEQITDTRHGLRTQQIGHTESTYHGPTASVNSETEIYGYGQLESGLQKARNDRCLYAHEVCNALMLRIKRKKSSIKITYR